MKTVEIEETSINVNSTFKRCEPSPLNVYLRLRPFIGDELERGENQKLIEILDNKHIAVKIYPTIYNTIRTCQASYNEYEVTRIFDHHCTQQDLFEQILDQPINEIFAGSNWLFCTLGLTNSGKTHTMFGTMEEPGLIPQCLRRIFSNVGQRVDQQLSFKPLGLENFTPTINGDLQMEITARNYIFKDEKSRRRLPEIIEQQNSFDDLSTEDESYSIWISFFELYNENILDLLVRSKDIRTRKHLRLIQNDHSTMIKNLVQIPVFDIREAEEIIKFGFANRATSRTNLNEASSRSHAVICITLLTINPFDEEPTMTHMYICDLAGNEPITGTGKQLTETCNINTSLMTFKDCIRVLNENQSAKKQMLIPYRNSVLTSIFRPFFVGRGRTIICCNINPCATFITQTNDLLKFCALAQKTVVAPSEIKTGRLIRTQRKSKKKGPKRLTRQSLSKKKHLHINKVDEPNLDTSSLIYWKCCANRALNLLEKQASNRRMFLIERHRERVETVQYLLHQRQTNGKLFQENQSLIEQNEILSQNLRLEQDKHLHTQNLYNELTVNDTECRQKFLQLEKDYQEEIQRLKRDFALELYRKQDAEKKARLFEEKFRHEQTLHQKMQYDFTQTKHELKTLQVNHDALQLELLEMHQKPEIKPVAAVEMFADRTSTSTTVYEEPDSVRSKRRTNDEDQQEHEVKKSKRVSRSESTISTATTVTLAEPSEEPMGCVRRPIRSKCKEQHLTASIKRTRNQTTAARDRLKKSVVEPTPVSAQQESHSPIYATIQRKRSADRTSFATVAVKSSTDPSDETVQVTPKPSTFKRIQSFFRVTPTSTNSGKINRILQVKNTVVAFGSSTPTNRFPPSIVKTPGPTPKSRYNLRTRLFNNPQCKDDDEKKSQLKKPVRSRK